LLIEHLTHYFPNGNYLCAYEAGFSGYVLYEELEARGIPCLVIHPADVPTTDKESEFKADKIDALKIAKALRSNLLEGIAIPDKERQVDRALVRLRGQFKRDIVRQKSRIRSLLMFFGVRIPSDIDSTHWYRKMRNWIWEQELINPNGTLVLQAAMDHLEYLLLMRTRLDAQLRGLANSPRHIKQTELLCSIPGIGKHTAISIITELGDISRFYNLDQLCNYIGLVPATHNSGETLRQGRLTYRGHRTLRSLLIESAWTAVRIDPALSLAFTELKKRMVSQKAIVRIARKLLSRIRYVLTHQEKYELGIVQ
jgi:transposase